MRYLGVHGEGGSAGSAPVPPPRFEALAQQYKATYPTLAIDTEAELRQLKVTRPPKIPFISPKNPPPPPPPITCAPPCRFTPRGSVPW